MTKDIPENYKKFRGQLIESICICSVIIEMDAFRPYASTLIDALLHVQENYVGDVGDPQRSYLLAAWQKLVLLMEKEFTPYLSKVIPIIFKMDSLQPKMSKSDAGEDILKFLAEVKLATGEKGVSLSSEQLDEKKVGIQML